MYLGNADGMVVSIERTLLVLSGLEAEQDLHSYECKIEDIFARFLKKCNLTHFSDPSNPPLYLHRDIAECLFQYLWNSKPKRFGDHFLLADVIDAQLDANISHAVGTCIGLTSLYSVLGLRAGLNLSLLVNADHMLSRLRVGRESLDMDHTDPQGFDCRSSSEFRELPLWTLAANVLNSRGLRHEMSGRFQDARADYERAIAVNPDYANAYNNRGNMRFRDADLQGAVADYTDALRLDPTFAEAHCNRGMAWQKLERYKEARDDYTRALSLDSGYGDAMRCLELLDEIESTEPADSRTRRGESTPDGIYTQGADGF